MKSEGAKPTYFSRFVLLALCLFLTVKALEGPVRYALVSADIEWAIYVPTFLLMLVVLLRGLLVMHTWRISRVMLIVTLALLGASGLGMVLIGNPAQVLFGIYVWVPFLFGAALAQEIVPHLRRLYCFFVLLWLVSVAGVFLNYFFDWPWAGFVYKVSGISIEGTRKWSTFGIERLAGFARASFEAAIIIFILSLLLLIYGKNRWTKPAVWLIGGGAIVLTTTKGIMAAYLAVTLLLLVRPWTPAFILRAAPFVVAIVVMAFPLYSWTQDISLILKNEVDCLLLASFEDRLTYTWPAANELVFQHGAGPVGRGVGGIGAAQDRFEKTLYNPADNLFVYLFGIAGYLAVILMLLIAYRVSRFAGGRQGEATFFYLLGMGILIYGLTTNVVESAYMGMFLGIVVRSASYFGTAAVPSRLGVD
ncbi:hypothetical protein [Moorella sp. E306M]|uniref:hypothetical protein n=1 Tax=Moorella sp. E306M TaxID=2572683 RepID=UPI0011439EEE|nr:hypothetical protein [Moorella sp. E306M]